MKEFNEDQININKTAKNEYSDVGKPEPVKEYGSYKKAKTTAKVTSLIITIIGASLVLGSFLTFTFTYNKITTTVERFDITPGNESVNYNVYISKTSAKPEQLILKLHGMYETRTVQISQGETTGSFSGLKAGTVYDVSILERNVLVATKKVTTYASES